MLQFPQKFINKTSGKWPQITQRLTAILVAMVFVLTFSANTYALNPVEQIYESPEIAPTTDALRSEDRNTAWYDPSLESGACNAIAGSAAEALGEQPHLDQRWTELIVREASNVGADPLAMVSVLYWENRRFPDFGPHTAGSDTIGRGPWQIIAATWAGHQNVLPENERDYHANVIHPEQSTKVAASIVKNYGGVAGVPVGSLNQNFGRDNNDRPVNTPSIATFSKNYNAGQATWRNPGQAGHLETGRTWMDGSRGPWFNDKQKIIDDYIVASTYIYYKLAVGEELPATANTDHFVSEGMSRQTEMENFSFLESSDGSQAPACVGGGEFSDIILRYAWSDYLGNGYTKRTDRDGVDLQGSGSGKPCPVRNADCYVQAMSDAAANNEYTGSCGGVDCGAFVTRVMRDSGLDPNYNAPESNVAGGQYPYLESRTTETVDAQSHRNTCPVPAGVQASGEATYVKLRNVQSTADLCPGDIWINSSQSHTFIYVGDIEGFNGNIAEASECQRAPMASNAYGFGNDNLNFWYRLKVD